MLEILIQLLVFSGMSNCWEKWLIQLIANHIILYSLFSKNFDRIIPK